MDYKVHDFLIVVLGPWGSKENIAPSDAREEAEQNRAESVCFCPLSALAARLFLEHTN